MNNTQINSKTYRDFVVGIMRIMVTLPPKTVPVVIRVPAC
jgi:hypothetical protein